MGTHVVDVASVWARAGVALVAVAFAHREEGDRVALDELGFEPPLEGRRLWRRLRVVPLLEAEAEGRRRVCNIRRHHFEADRAIAVHVVLTRLIAVGLAHKVLGDPGSGAEGRACMTYS